MRADWQDAEDQFQKQWFGKTRWCYRFGDTREAMGSAGSRRVFTKPRPSDFLVVDNGNTFFAEVKSSHHETSFPLSAVQTPQWSAAVQTTSAGGSYFFYIKQETVSQWYCVPAYALIALQKEGFKSVKWTHLEGFKCNFLT